MPVTNFPNGINAGDVSGNSAELQVGGVAISATPAELNTLDGVLGAKALSFDSSTVYVATSGSTAITGAGTVTTSLGGAVQFVVASLANAADTGGTIGPTAPAVVFARPSGSAGAVIFQCYATNGGTAATAGTVHYFALGTAAS